MTICLSDLDSDAREELTLRVFEMLEDVLDDGAIVFDGAPEDYEAVADGVWVPCRIFVPNGSLT